MKKISYVIISVMLLGTIFTGCGKEATTSESTSAVSQKKKYTIATDATFAPFEYEKEGKYIGIDMDLLDAIAKLEGFTYELKPMDFKGIIPALQANQIDGAIAGMSITEERKKVLDMSEGYFESGISVVAKEGNTKINAMQDLKGKTFAVKKGTAGAKYAEDNQSTLNCKINYFNDSPSMFQEVKNGNADVTIEDYPVIAYAISVDPNSGYKIIGDKLCKNYYGFAVSKGQNKELLDKFNDGLKKLKANGEYDKIISKYIKQ